MRNKIVIELTVMGLRDKEPTVHQLSSCDYHKIFKKKNRKSERIYQRLERRGCENGVKIYLESIMGAFAQNLFFFGSQNWQREAILKPESSITVTDFELETNPKTPQNSSFWESRNANGIRL